MNVFDDYIKRMKKVMEEKGLFLKGEALELAWRKYSDEMFDAGFIGLPESDSTLYDILLIYLGIIDYDINSIKHLKEITEFLDAGETLSESLTLVVAKNNFEENIEKQLLLLSNLKSYLDIRDLTSNKDCQAVPEFVYHQINILQKKHKSLYTVYKDDSISWLKPPIQLLSKEDKQMAGWFYLNVSLFEKAWLNRNRMED